uniref:RxLR effector protein n=1 Tax=Peronospora matthiolae TaxID=2874970 RepID=A0AAV1VLA2_9STRA
MRLYWIPLAILVANSHASGTALSRPDHPVSEVNQDVAPVTGVAAHGADDGTSPRHHDVLAHKTEEERLVNFGRFAELLKRYIPYTTGWRVKRMRKRRKDEREAVKRVNSNFWHAMG